MSNQNGRNIERRWVVDLDLKAPPEGEALFVGSVYLTDDPGDLARLISFERYGDATKYFRRKKAEEAQMEEKKARALRNAERLIQNKKRERRKKEALAPLKHNPFAELLKK